MNVRTNAERAVLPLQGQLGATSSTYTVQSSDSGKIIKVRVTFTAAANDESPTSEVTSAVVMGGL